MKTSRFSETLNSRLPEANRQGTVVILTVLLLIVVMAFTAFSVDIGYMALTRTEMRNASDAAALTGATELADGLGPGALVSANDIIAVSQNAAVDIAALNKAGDVAQIYLKGTRDCRIGQLTWDSANQSWIKNWGVAPYNLFEATVRRNQNGSSNGDRPLPLYFAPVIGHDIAELESTSTAALLPGVGFRISANSSQTAGILPITLDEPTWNNLLQGVGTDNYAYDEATGTVTCGSDGILEVNLYPNGSTTLPPGNRGTVDIGHQGNSSSDIKRQILYGLNADDLSYFGGEFRFDNVPLILNGDTGLSAGIKAQLTAIIGQPRAIPIFSSVSGPGNNANYTIVKFVGIRVLDVKLTGSPSKKHVTIQPAPFVDATVIAGHQTIEVDSILSPVSLIR